VSAAGGRLVFSYHNKRNARRVVRYPFARGSTNPFSPEPVEVWPTLLSRHPSQIARLVDDAGFTAPQYQGTVVVNSLARITERFGSWAPAGSMWAPIMGRFRLAPWLIGSSHALGGGGLRPGDSIDDLFQCPVCRGDVERSDGGYECRACQSEYPIEDGIVDFRP